MSTSTVPTLKPSQLSEYLLQIAPVRPVFIWGPPGIGKTDLVNNFSNTLGYECVSLLGSQLAPEDLIGVPTIEGNVSKFKPPSLIVKDKPFCLFIDEINACSAEIQKAFFSLILNQSIGEYNLPKGSVIIVAGNRNEDNALVKMMPSPLINRVVQITLKSDPSDWLKWAAEVGIHPFIQDFISIKPNALFSKPPKTQDPFSTPRSWHMLSDCLKQFPKTELTEQVIQTLAYGTVTSRHASEFIGFYKTISNKYMVHDIIKGKESWPTNPKDSDLLYFLVQCFRDHLIKNLPETKDSLSGDSQSLAYESKPLIKQLADINLELAQLVASEPDENGKILPSWYLMDLIKVIPRLSSTDN